MSFKSEDYNYAKCKTWLDSLYKVNMQLEKIINNLPQTLSKTDSLEALNSLDIIMRRASRLEYQLKNIENR